MRHILRRTWARWKRLKLSDHLQIAAQILIAGATISYAIIARRQWIAMHDSLALTRESNDLTRWNIEGSLRAWMVVSQFNATQEGQGTVVTARFKNVGRLPATYVYIHSVARTFEDDRLPKNPPYNPSLSEGSLYVVGPDQTTDVRYPLFELPPEVRNAVNNDRALYLYGSVTYWDPFGIERGLLFCDVLRNRRLNVCPRYNFAW